MLLSSFVGQDPLSLLCPRLLLCRRLLDTVNNRGVLLHNEDWLDWKEDWEMYSSLSYPLEWKRRMFKKKDSVSVTKIDFNFCWEIERETISRVKRSFYVLCTYFTKYFTSREHTRHTHDASLQQNYSCLLIQLTCICVYGVGGHQDLLPFQQIFNCVTCIGEEVSSQKGEGGGGSSHRS
jgi:hypothetical protein